ncbi:SnoaL-like domain-containing protein [Aspergillus pseudodeflectus]|uniref:SnoaL-like domain-containing protein n=1 Tax=Aspergillus pseudodeflectus TaxID=176178 RepID=A0ABR4J862_9EURO
MSSSTPNALPILLSPSLTPREAISDALYRCIEGVDTKNKALFDSSFTQTATFEVNGAVSEGLAAIHANCFDIIGPKNTTHFVSNIRIHIDESGEKAAMSAYALAQHYREGEGLKGDQERLLTGNFYQLQLVREAGLAEGEFWRIETFVVKSSWAEGQWGVLKAA